MSNIKIPLGKPDIGKEEIDRISEVVKSGCCAGTCDEVRQFEDKFAKYIGSKYAIATSSCTTALHIACRVLELNERSNVTVPTHTFPATAMAAMYEGVDVHITDVDQNTYNMDMSKVYAPVGSTIIPVHSFGNPCNMPEIMDIAREADLKVIEDSACGVASTLCGKHTGTFGDIGCYSFYGIKELCTGEGGMLVTDNIEYADLARSLVDFGKTSTKPLPTFDMLGYNYRLSAIQAAMGIVQLDKMPTMHKNRQRIANIYNTRIENEFEEGEVTIQEVIPGAVHSYQRYAVILGEWIDRDNVIDMMAERGVQTTIGTFDLSSIPMFGVLPSSNLVGRHLFEQSLSLPMYSGMTTEQADEVINGLRQTIWEISK